MLDDRPGLVILTGPTAVGKTALSVRLAQQVGGEIVSADSMQVYRHMDIGSAKVTLQERQGVPHHLIDVLEPEESFHVVAFQKLAKEAIAQIHARGHIPILTGGTGFYIQSVLYDIDFTQTGEDEGLRERLEAYARQNGPEELHKMLRQADPKAAEAIHPNNVKRVIRALEYCAQTGEPISAHNEMQRDKNAAYRALYFVLTDDRQRIYERIDRRVDGMMQNGLVEEVRALKERGLRKDMVSMQGLGYRQILSYLDGEYDLERAVYLIKRDTRHFAKRQLTWFSRERDVIWVDRRAFESEDQMLDSLVKQVKETLL